MEKPKAEKINKKCSELKEIFYNGDKLTPLELDIERMYITEKLSKH